MTLTTPEVFDGFYAAQARLLSYTPENLSGRAIYGFSPSQATKRIPMHVRTGAQTLQTPGSPVERKYFRQIEFHGTGTAFVRVYVDNIWIMDSNATMSETPSKLRRIGLPIGTKGYTIDLEFAGDCFVRAIEYEFSGTGATS